LKEAEGRLGTVKIEEGRWRTECARARVDSCRRKAGELKKVEHIRVRVRTGYSGGLDGVRKEAGAQSPKSVSRSS